MTLGAHVIETTRAQAFSDAARSLAGLSWSNPGTRDEYSRRLAPHDPLERAEQMASAQSSCALTCCAALFECGVDGLVRSWRGKLACDPLREPRWKQYDGLMFLEQLARQRSAHRPVGTDRPDIFAGSWVLIGGGAAQGGAAHIVCVVDVEHDGTLVTVEGGKFDPGNPRSGAEACTRIAADRRELYQQADGSWWMRDAGTTRPGRRCIYWCWAGDLPLVGGA